MDTLLEFVIAATFGDIVALLFIIGFVSVGIAMVIYNILSPLATIATAKIAAKVISEEKEG